MSPPNPFLQLTAEFNAGRVRAIVCSGQAVVLHRLAMVSKDGDWIVREAEEDLAHLRTVLSAHEARYRYGAPLDTRWLAGGWSAHLEFRGADGTRVRTDFFSRPPRLSAAELASLWDQQHESTVPVVGLRELSLMKMTQREKDYPIIGELARRMLTVAEQLTFSRSALDLLRLAEQNPELSESLEQTRPLLRWARTGQREPLEKSLDEERRQLIHADADRLRAFQKAARDWQTAWPALESATAGLPLEQAHAILCEAAQKHLPLHP